MAEPVPDYTENVADWSRHKLHPPPGRPTHHRRTRSTRSPVSASRCVMMHQNHECNKQLYDLILLLQKIVAYCWLVGWLCLTSDRQRGHLETAPPFTVHCEGREARQIHCSHRESNPGPSGGSPLRYCCNTQAPS